MTDYLRRAEAGVAAAFRNYRIPDDGTLILNDIVKHLRQQQHAAQSVDNPVHILEPVHDAESFTLG